MTSNDLEAWKTKLFKDEITMNIFQKISHSPKSANQISYECDIPLATVYRKLKNLDEKKLVDISGTMVNDKHRTKLYKKKSLKLDWENR